MNIIKIMRNPENSANSTSDAKPMPAIGAWMRYAACIAAQLALLCIAASGGPVSTGAFLAFWLLQGMWLERRLRAVLEARGVTANRPVAALGWPVYYGVVLALPAKGKHN